MASTEHENSRRIEVDESSSRERGGLCLWGAEDDLGIHLGYLSGKLLGRRTGRGRRVHASGSYGGKKDGSELKVPSRDTECDIFVGALFPNAIDIAESMGKPFYQASQLGFGDGLGWVLGVGMEDGVLFRTAMFRVWLMSLVCVVWVREV